MFKSSLLICLVPIAAFMSSSATNESAELEAKSSGVGDIRMSFVNPQEFFATNNVGTVQWVLVNGDDKNFTGAFTRATGLKKGSFPDARGVFLRGMNAGRKQKGDPDGDRAIGGSQADQFQTHSHSLRYHNSKTTGDRPHDNFEYPTSPGNRTLVTTAVNSGRHGSETRPRNIAVYIYVRTR